MPTDRRWSDAEREPALHSDPDMEQALLAVGAIWGRTGMTPLQVVQVVRDALIAAGWRREADVRAEVSTEIAAAVRQQLTEGGDHA